MVIEVRDFKKHFNISKENISCTETQLTKYDLKQCKEAGASICFIEQNSGIFICGCKEGPYRTGRKGRAKSYRGTDF